MAGAMLVRSGIETEREAEMLARAAVLGTHDPRAVERERMRRT